MVVSIPFVRHLFDRFSGLAFNRQTKNQTQDIYSTPKSTRKRPAEPWPQLDPDLRKMMILTVPNNNSSPMERRFNSFDTPESQTKPQSTSPFISNKATDDSTQIEENWKLLNAKSEYPIGMRVSLMRAFIRQSFPKDSPYRQSVLLPRASIPTGAAIDFHNGLIPSLTNAKNDLDNDCLHKRPTGIEQHICHELQENNESKSLCDSAQLTIAMNDRSNPDYMVETCSPVDAYKSKGTADSTVSRMSASVRLSTGIRPSMSHVRSVWRDGYLVTPRTQMLNPCNRYAWKDDYVKSVLVTDYHNYETTMTPRTQRTKLARREYRLEKISDPVSKQRHAGSMEPLLSAAIGR